MNNTPRDPNSPVPNSPVAPAAHGTAPSGVGWLALASCVTAVLLSPATAMAGPAGFTVSQLDAVPTEEGGEASFTVTLTSSPGSGLEVMLDVTSSNPSEVMIIAEDPSPITQYNWWQPRRFWAIGLDDEIEDGDAPTTISISAAPGSDPAYVALSPVLRATENLDDETTLVFDSPYVRCVGPDTEDIYDGRVIGLHYDRDQALADEATMSPKPEFFLEFDPNDAFQDDRVFAENWDRTYLHLRTLHVVLRNTMTRSLTDDEAAALQRSYARAAHRIHTASHGLVALDFDQVALNTEFGWSSFIDDDDSDPWYTAQFVDYPKLAFALAFVGYNYDEYDIISVSVAFTDDPPYTVRTDVAAAVPPPDFDFSVPYTNPETWKNDRTWTTVQYTTDPYSTKWADIDVHELTHDLEWMLEYANFTEMRNPDDVWWSRTYTEQESLDMFWARPKADFFYIPAPWGNVEHQPATHIVEMSCRDENTYQERRVYCPLGVTCGIGCECNKPRE